MAEFSLMKGEESDLITRHYSDRDHTAIRNKLNAAMKLLCAACEQFPNDDGWLTEAKEFIYQPSCSTPSGGAGHD